MRTKKASEIIMIIQNNQTMININNYNINVNISKNDFGCSTRGNRSNHFDNDDREGE